MIIPVRDTAHWHELRARHVGASEVAALFDAQPPYGLSRFALWQVKAGRIPAPEVTGNRPDAGKRFERAAGDWLADTQGWAAEPFPGYAVSDTVGGLGATPDFRVQDPVKGDGLLEVKWSDWLAHRREWLGEPPLHIGLQLQHQLAATGLGWGAVGCVVGGNEPVVYRFERRPKIIAEIERRVGEFWRSVEAGQEPPPDGADSTTAALRAMFPEAEPELEVDVTGDNEFPLRYAALKQARLDRRAAEAAEAAAANWILRRAGAAEIIKSDGQVVATAKSSKRRGYTVEPSIVRTLRLKEEV